MRRMLVVLCVWGSQSAASCFRAKDVQSQWLFPRNRTTTPAEMIFNCGGLPPFSPGSSRSSAAGWCRELALLSPSLTHTRARARTHTERAEQTKRERDSRRTQRKRQRSIKFCPKWLGSCREASCRSSSLTLLLSPAAEPPVYYIHKQRAGGGGERGRQGKRRERASERGGVGTAERGGTPEKPAFTLCRSCCEQVGSGRPVHFRSRTRVYRTRSHSRATDLAALHPNPPLFSHLEDAQLALKT